MEFDHFLRAQDSVYDRVLRELGDGRKESHWMWFVFPQLRGLGASPMALMYAIDSLDQALRYIGHPILGSRLRECAELAVKAPAKSAQDIFGYPDWMKFRSSMTLFSLCSPPGGIFRMALEKYFSGTPDERTMGLLGVPAT